MSVQIEKNIPIPEPKKRKCKYPFNEMEVGDSFFYPIENNLSTNEMQMRLVNASCSFNRKNGNTYKFRSTQLKNGVRIWRIK